ncbi:hypothetical protein [Lachnobacterium bovis]|uniref:hypothetical protein n=1 Tax=Lachnobacterium bovis TaxID=140626 RepID=UPI00048C1564|nr:hypothetical protein [Lachnobacterium bovis]
MKNIMNLKKIIFCCVLFIGAIKYLSLDVKAANYDAKNFVEQFGSSVKFVPQENPNVPGNPLNDANHMWDRFSDDGDILYGTEGTAAVSQGIRYSTIGWKVNVWYNDATGAKREEIYFKLGGSYMQRVSEVSSNGVEYNLYSIKLSVLRSRMSPQAREAMNRGQANFTLDACVSLKQNGVLLSDMNDNGCTRDIGHFYTDHNGIANAAPWRSATKEKLKTYFNKNIDGLMIRINVEGDEGIASVSGSGNYLYGTNVNISKSIKNGFDFTGWKVVSAQNQSFLNTGINSENFNCKAITNITYRATTKRKQTRIVFHRNESINDTVIHTEVFTYGDNDVAINPDRWNDKNWIKDGFHQVGWAFKPDEQKAYGMDDKLNKDWLLSKSPKIDLYAVWEENTYVIRYDGNGAFKGHIDDVSAKYSEKITTSNNEFDKPIEDSTYLGWSQDKKILFSEYKEKQTVSVKELATKAGCLHENNAVIMLYATWNYWPTISAKDLYYSLEDAQNGIISEREIASKISAKDREDGNIQYGLNSKNFLKLINYSEEEFINLKDKADISEIICVKDQHGKLIEKEINIHITDIKPLYGKDAVGKIRFYDKKYKNTLFKYSVWKNKNYQNELE